MTIVQILNIIITLLLLHCYYYLSFLCISPLRPATAYKVHDQLVMYNIHVSLHAAIAAQRGSIHSYYRLFITNTQYTLTPGCEGAISIHAFNVRKKIEFLFFYSKTLITGRYAP